MTRLALFWLALFWAGQAEGGAWPMPKGEGQVIVRYERQTADRAFDSAGELTEIEPRWDESATAFIEYGLTNRLTFQGKFGMARGDDRFTGYEGGSPAEFGLRWNALASDRIMASVYLGAIAPGEGENAIYVSRVRSRGDLELRALAGRSHVLFRRPAFAEVQVARLWRIEAGDETRLDITSGVEPARNWLLLLQVYGGMTDAGAALQPGWLNQEVSVVRRFRGWSAQAGWRTAVQGRDTTRGSGPVVAIWRAF